MFAQESLLTTLVFEDSPEETESWQAAPEPPRSEPSDEMTPEELKKYLENLRPEDFGKFNI
jgi:hypothetical protein